MPLDETSTVSVSASVCISVAAPSVIEPDNVLLPDTLRMAPTRTLDSKMPVPDTLRASAITMPPLSDNVAPSAIVVLPADVPSEPSFETAITPVDNVVVPVYVFAPDNVSVLEVDVFLVIVPEPEITPESVWSSDEEYTNAASFTMFDAKLFGVPAPSDPDSVTANVPEVIVSRPAKVLSADRASVPAASLVSA